MYFAYIYFILEILMLFDDELFIFYSIWTFSHTDKQYKQLYFLVLMLETKTEIWSTIVM